MSSTIRIQMMGNFALFINEQSMDYLVNKTRKGFNLMQYLILNHGRPVPNFRIISALWPEDTSQNPENALKTLVSRLRALLKQVSPELSECIVADRGAYHWQNVDCVSIDMYEIEDLIIKLKTLKTDPTKYGESCQRLLELYRGDLLRQNETSEWAMPSAISLHDDFMDAVYTYVEMLKKTEDYEKIAVVCRNALDVDQFDDRLHMEMMTALIKTDRTSDAMNQYKHVMHLNYHYLGVQPSADMQEFYKHIVNAGKTLDFNLESIRNELRESNSSKGAFVCEYAVFKEIYNLQMRNLERLGSTMFLGIVMVAPLEEEPVDSIQQDNLCNMLLDIMKTNLRKGDTITHVSPTIFALLLPTVNYTTGNMVMERLKRAFYRRYPNSRIAFNYLIGPLSSESNDAAELP